MAYGEIFSHNSRLFFWPSRAHGESSSFTSQFLNGNWAENLLTPTTFLRVGRVKECWLFLPFMTKRGYFQSTGTNYATSGGNRPSGMLADGTWRAVNYLGRMFIFLTVRVHRPARKWGNMFPQFPSGLQCHVGRRCSHWLGKMFTCLQVIVSILLEKAY